MMCSTCSSIELGKQIQAAGGCDGTQIGARWDAWKRAEGELINEARLQLGTS
jgi:hypothetical protein